MFVRSRMCRTRRSIGLAAALTLAVLSVGGAEPSGALPATPQTVRSTPERVAHMQRHFSRVLTVHDAVIRGDLAAVRPAAAWLADHDPEPSLAAMTGPIAEMRAAARRAADADTVLAAAIATATMLKTCGDCHRAAGTMPALPQTPRPDLGGIVGHMLRHQTAADQMAQGLITPSNTLWRAGAEGFKGAPLHPRALPAGVTLPASLHASEERIHQLASQALLAEDPGARAVFYGQILARCADCHATHRTLWGPGGR